MEIKQCGHKNQIYLTSMPPQFKCTDCGYTIEPSKKTKKKPTGILKDLMELKRLYINNDHGDVDMIESEIGAFVEWSDVEAIINKYLNP